MKKRVKKALAVVISFIGIAIVLALGIYLKNKFPWIPKWVLAIAEFFLICSCLLIAIFGNELIDD